MSAIIFTGNPTPTQNLVPVANIPTVEALTAYACELLYAINGASTETLIEGQQTNRVIRQLFMSASKKQMLTYTVYLMLDPDFTIDGNKIWRNVLEWGQGTGSTGFNS